MNRATLEAPDRETQTLHRLQAEHAELDAEIRALDEHTWLSTDEQMRRQRLKKLRLLKKDQMTVVRRHGGG